MVEGTAGGTKTPARQPTPPKTYERFIATCVFPAPLCEFSNRPKPTHHSRKTAARREAMLHAIEAGHVGVKAITVSIKRKVTTTYSVVQPSE